MRMISRIGAVATFAAAAAAAQADSFYCGQSIASEGMAMEEIRELCGQPDLVETVEVPVFARLENGGTARVGTQIKEVWYYDRGPNQFVAKITLDEGTADRIELLSVRDIDALGRK